MEPFLGRWKLHASDNFDEYMKEVGVNLVTRGIASALKPDYVISAEGDGLFNLRTESTFKNNDLRFKLGEEFEETTSDGRKLQTTITLDGNKLTQQQHGGKTPSEITRELTDDKTLICTCKANTVVSTRIYKRAT